jgi:hypothetical protein
MLSFKPPLGIILLAFGTMMVLAGVVTVLDLLAIRANIDMTAKGLCTTAFDIPHRPVVAGRHAAFVLCSVGRTMLAEDLRQLYHSRLSNTWLMVSRA